MRNPGRILAERFVRLSPPTILAFGFALSLLDFLALYLAATKEGVLYIEEGVGLLSNQGILSTILGNAFFLFLAKQYYDAICSAWDSKAVVDSARIERYLSALSHKVKMQDRAKFLLYFMVVIGALAWLSNFATHIFGNYEDRWGYQVFDSPNHQLTFWASRFHNLLTWVLIMPFVGYVLIVGSIQLWRTIAAGLRERALCFDLLNPDQRGGFSFVDKAAISFNLIAVAVYLQITLHIGTFKVNLDHLMAYVLVTILLVTVNVTFFSGIYSSVRQLRLAALEKVKNDVFKDNKLSFEVLKYCYERRLSARAVLSFVLNPGAVAVSGFAKLWPLISRAL